MTNQNNNNDDDNILRISDIEERLINDESGQFRDHLMNDLFKQMVELKSLQNEGSSPENFNNIESLINAVAAAGETVYKTWQKHHKKVQQPSN